MICAIILAAGSSLRMGEQKLLLPFGSGTMIELVADAFLQPPVDLVLVVVRPGSLDLRAALADRRVQFVENRDPQGDMLSSVRCGLKALPSTAQTILVTPGDLPRLTAGLIRQVLEAFRGAAHGILVPVHAGRRGHPLVFSCRYRDKILSRFDAQGLCGLLQAHADDVIEWPAPDPAVLDDVDAPEDYQRALCLHRSQPIPPAGATGGSRNLPTANA